MSTAHNGEVEIYYEEFGDPARADPSPRQRPRVTVPELRRGVVPALQ